MRQVPLSLFLLHKWCKQGTAWLNNSLAVVTQPLRGKSQDLNPGSLLHNPNFATLCSIASHEINGIQNEYSQKFPLKNYPIGTQIIFIRLSSRYSPSANTKLAAQRTTSWKSCLHTFFLLFNSHFCLGSLQSGFHTHYFTEMHFFKLISDLLLQPPLDTSRYYHIWGPNNIQQSWPLYPPCCTFLTVSIALLFPNLLPTIGATSLSCLQYLLLYPTSLPTPSPLMILTYLLLQISSMC